MEVVGSNGVTLNIQWSLEESCWDYTFCDGNGDEIDGGQVGNYDDYNMKDENIINMILDFHEPEITLDSYTINRV